MKINKCLYISAALLMLAGCGDDWNEDKLDGFIDRPSAVDIKNIEYTLTDADYKTIATNKTNKALAEAEGMEDQLAKLTGNKYFTEQISASKYIPAFLAATYPTLDDKSSVKVTYNKLTGEPDYLAAIGDARTYTLTEEDYQTVWGQVVKASFLSPKTESRIPKLLSAVMPDAVAGDMVMVDYAYSETEPSVGGGGSTAEPTWTQVAAIPVRSTGANWDFVNMGPINLSEYKGQTVNIAFRYTSTASGAATWELKNAKILAVPYLDVCLFAKTEDGSFAKVGKSSSFKGAGDYVIVSVGADGQYYPFGRLPDGKIYGYMYPDPIKVESDKIAAADAADYIITLDATEAGFTLKNALGQYFYMSGNYDSFNVTTEVGAEGYDWTVASAGGSDLFTITNVLKQKSVKLNYYNGSYSFGSYAASKVEGFTYYNETLLGTDGGFTIYDVNTDGLSFIWKNDAKYGFKASAFVDNVNHATESYLVSPAIEISEDAALPYITIDEAFRFGKAEELTVWVSTDYAALAASATLKTRMAYNSNRAGLYAFDGSAWSKHGVDGKTLDVMQPADYTSLGTGYLSSPATVLPVYLKNKYPYAQAEDVVAVAYYASADGAVAAKEMVYDGAVWNMTLAAVPMVDQFVKSNGTWVYDPSVVLDLPVGKGQPLSTLYYQAMTDWVWENIDSPKGLSKGQGYVTTYGNNEYYTGASAYQGNADWRKSAADTQYPEEYKEMSEADFLPLIQKRFVEVLGHVLADLNSDAKMVDGVDVFYTVNFGVYTGVNENWTVVYKLVADGQFEYVEDSLKKL